MIARPVLLDERIIVDDSAPRPIRASEHGHFEVPVDAGNETHGAEHLSPPARAVAFTSSNNLRGRALARNRFRIPTSTLGWNDPAATGNPAAAFHRRSNASRSTASPSDRPSWAGNSITVATIRAGTVGRPSRDTLNRSAK